MAVKTNIPDPYERFEPDFEKNLKPEEPSNSPTQIKNEVNAKETIQKFWYRATKAQQAVNEKHIKWRVLDKFDRGEQWKDIPAPPWIPKPVTNIMRQIRTLKRANLASGISRSTFTPLHPEDVDPVHLLQLAHDHVWDTHRVDRHVRRCIDRALIQGTSILYIYNDNSFFGGKYYDDVNYDNNADPTRDGSAAGKPNGKKRSSQLYQGDIRLKRWPNQNFFPDPDAYTLEECKWIDTTEIVPLRNVKNNPAFVEYCRASGTLEKLASVTYTQLEYDNDASGTIYDRDVTPLDNPRNVQGDEIITLHTHWERYYKDGKWHLDCTYWLRNTDFFLLRLEDIQPSEYPFAILYDEEEENDFWGTSTLMDILENQKLLNKVQQVVGVLGALHQNPQKIVFKQSGINAQEVARTSTLPGKTYESNVPPEQAMKNVDPPPIPKELFQLADQIKQDIDTTVGTNEAYTGQSVGSVTTSTGVSDLIERATIRDKDKMIQIDAFIERISHLIALHILYKWEDKRPISRIDKNGQPVFGEWEPMSKLDADNLMWRVRSDIYLHAPVTQAQRRQQANNLLQWQGTYNFQPAVVTPEEFIRMQELQDQEEILQRMQKERVQLQQQDAQNLANQIMQVANAIHQQKTQGLSDQDANQYAMQIAQQLVQQQQDQENKNGTQPSQSQGPRGVTGQVQMAAMAHG